VPVIGLFVVMVWGAADLSTRWARRRLVLPGAGGLVLLGCVAATSLQLRHWQNSLTLLEHALRLAPENAITHVMLGNAFFERGRLDEALSHYQEALRLRRDYAEPWQRAGVVLSQQQRTVEAIQHFRTAIQLAPAWPEPRRSLALALVGQGHTQEARAEYQAIAALLPADAEGRTKLAEMLAEGQQWADAARVYQEALRLDPDFSPALNNLAWLRATCPQAEFRAGPEAIRLAERACQLTRRNPYFVGALAAAYAEAGRYAEAIQAVQEAHGLARAAGATNLLPVHAQMLSRFQAGKPFHEGEP
jgi:tetratricopeptide (TPR) repeat protein